MLYKQYTKVPNFIIDRFLPKLTLAELKILLVVIRQTIGWKIPETGERKYRDRLTCRMFQRKTGLCKRVVANAVKSLVNQNLISVTDYRWKELKLPKERKGKFYLYFAPVISGHLVASRREAKSPVPTQPGAHDKRRYPKENDTKEITGEFQPMSEALRQSRFGQTPNN